MSYQVLARKWRPRAFTEMVGQEHVLRALINGLDNDRLHHAYLFTGTRGVGKTTLARILAKCLNCETGVSSIPCNQCSSCREIAEGRFVDLIEVDAASRTKVEDTRELLENVQYAPTRGRYKVYLIDEVHMLSNHSFNALLKTLEEPPPHVKFLLATTDPQKLPVTILSRCMQFNLKNLNPERIVGHLKHVLGEEKIPYEEAALWELGRSADGSMRDALSLTDQAIAHGGGTLTTAEVNAMLGTIDRTSVVEICQAVAAADAPRAMARVEHMAEHAPDYGAALAEMLSLWHQVAIAQTVPDALDPVQENHQAVLELARTISREDVQLLYQITLLGRKDLPYAADARSGFEMVLLRLLAFRPLLPDQAQMPAASVPAAAVKKENGPVPEAATPAKKPESPPPPVVAVVPQSLAQPVQPQAAPPVGRVGAETAMPALEPKATHGVAAPVRGTVSAARPEPSANLDVLDDDDDSTLASYESYLASAPDAGHPPTPAPTDPRVEADILPPATAPNVMAADRIPLASLSPENWHNVCENLGQGGLLQNTALNMVLESVEGRRLQFLLDRDNSALYDESQQERLAAALSDYFGCTITLNIRVAQVAQETPRRIAERLRAERLQQAIDSLKADPHVQEIVQLFGAQLVESSVKPID